MKKWLVALACLISQTAHASYDFTGLIASIYMGPGYGSLVFIQVATPPTGTVTCGTNTTYDFAFDSSTTAGKTALASLLTAYAAQKTVRLTSSDTCSLYAGIPDLNALALE